MNISNIYRLIHNAAQWLFPKILKDGEITDIGEIKQIPKHWILIPIDWVCFNIISIYWKREQRLYDAKLLERITRRVKNV